MGEVQEVFRQIINRTLPESISIKSGDILAFIRRLRQSYNTSLETTTSTEFVYNLASISLKDDSGAEIPYRPRVKIGTEANLQILKRGSAPIRVKLIGGGSYGEIWTSTDGSNLTYKRVIPRAGDSLEKISRNFLCESWIQTILNTDPRFGLFTAQLTGLFRDHRFTRSRDVRSTVPLLFISMEYIPYPFGKLIENNMTAAQLRGILHLLAEIFIHFQSTYQFYHRDFHAGNLMLSNEGLKIIDFGMSCLQYEGELYSMPVPERNLIRNLSIKPKSCFSYDFFTFLISLREIYDSRPSDVTAYLDSLVTSPDGTNMFLLLSRETPPNEAVFWQTYYYNIDELNRKYVDVKGKTKSFLVEIMNTPAFHASGLFEKTTYTITGLKLSQRFPPLQTLKSSIASRLPIPTPQKNIASAIATLSKTRGGKSTRSAGRKNKKTRKQRK